MPQSKPINWIAIMVLSNLMMICLSTYNYKNLKPHSSMKTKMNDNKFVLSI